MAIPFEIQHTLEACGGFEKLKALLPPDNELTRRGKIFTALSDPTRLKVLYLLNLQPLCVCIIKEVLSIADSKLSYHLKTLSNAGLIIGEQKGTWIIYSITESGRRALMIWL